MDEQDNQRLMLLFSVGKTCFACDAEPIVEIVPRVKLNTIPHSPEYFSGLMNYGSQPVPVIDFCQLIANRPVSDSLHSRIIIFEHPDPNNSSLMGIAAEKVTETILLRHEDFLRSGIKSEKHLYLDGVYNSADGSIQYVNIDELFEKMRSIEKIAEVPNG